MCGISGFNFSDRAMAKKMISVQNHRGPDASGVFSDKHVTIGSNRLAIIDLSPKGRQPMPNEEGDVWIVFNGEIYNFLELRAELEKNHKFFSNTDTEVLVHAYEEWGPDFVKRLNGMWAFAIYDNRKKILIMSRDRMGKKPLYYYLKNGKLIFASEIKSILLHGVQTDIDKTALELYLTLSWIPAPFTIYRNIYKLPKASCAVFDLRGKKFTQTKTYYGLPKQTSLGRRIVEEVRDLMDDSVKKRMVADVPVGAFLSGGLDSSAITKTMIKFVPEAKKLHTFSIGFEDRDYDESEYANIIAEEIGTNHHHHVFQQKDFEKIMGNIYFYFDEPFADQSMYPTFKVSELARKHVTVSLSGDGGDELFGGYGHYMNYRRLELLRLSPRPLRILGKGFFAALHNTTKNRYALKFLSDFSTSLEKSRVPTPTGKTSKSLKKITASRKDLLAGSFDFDLGYTLVDGYLVKVDRASMANSLEIRCPFLDYRIIDAAQAIPIKQKVSATKTKILFRKIIEDRVPEKITGRKRKMGLTPPVTMWMFGEYRSLAEDKLERLMSSGAVSREAVEKAIGHLKSGQTMHAQDIFNLFSLQLWREKWQ